MMVQRLIQSRIPYRNQSRGLVTFQNYESEKTDKTDHRSESYYKTGKVKVFEISGGTPTSRFRSLA